MSDEAYQWLARAFITDIWNKGQVDLLEELVADTYCYHDPATVGPPPGHAYLKRRGGWMRSAFAAVQVSIDAQVRDGDQVTTWWSASGERRAKGGGRDGKLVLWGGVCIVRVAHGKILEHWSNTDDVRLLREIGALPPARPAPTTIAPRPPGSLRLPRATSEEQRAPVSSILRGRL